MKIKVNTHCPVCKNHYDNLKRIARHHHIFLQRWYGPDGLQVVVCETCHDEFHNVHFLTKRETPAWIPSVCVQNWVKFCKIKGQDAYKIYPELKKLQPMY